MKRSLNRVPIKRNTVTQICIACEGYTEQEYYNHLYSDLKKQGLNNIISIVSKKAHKQSADGVVDYAETYFYDKDLKDYKQIYCIFDKDRNTDEQIASAIEKANKIGAEIIFSNPCFEVWFYAHYKDKIKYITKDQLNNFLLKEDKLGENFKKQGKNNYHRLKDKTNFAIENSKKIDKGNIKYTEEGNPTTDNYKVIEYIQRKIKQPI